MKIVVSVILGIFLLISLTALDNYTNENFLGFDYSKQATLLKSNSLVSLEDGNCQSVPEKLRQYCNNISIQRYGHLFSTAKDNKEVPENDYVASLGHTAYQYCINSSHLGNRCQDFSSAEDLNNDTFTIFFIITEVAVSLFACSWAAYYLLNKFYVATNTSY